MRRFAVASGWLVVGGLSMALALPAGAAGPWAEVAEAPAAEPLAPGRAMQARWVRFDAAQLQAVFDQAAREAASGQAHRQALLTLPLADGSSLRLQLQPLAVMAPGLAARYPQITTWRGVAEGRAGVTARIDWSPRGLRAMIFTPEGRVFIDPGRGEQAGLHQVYRRQDLALRPRQPDRVLTVPGREASQRPGLLAGADIGPELLTYRLAIATTGEYARFHDPAASPTNKAEVLAELVSLTNRVSGVYERELAVKLQLVEDQDALIYTDPATDPYSNFNGGAMLSQNITTLRNVLGNDGFDVGHVVSTGGGGVAYLGVVCNNGFKAGGVTGLGTPVGDAFYIDYVAHEMGHQFGGNHSFNGTAGACGGNRAGNAAFEPGSGSTIMSYAGICGLHDLQPNSDAFFHSGSFDEIVSYTRNDDGASCAAVSDAGNRPPRAKAPAGGFTIPARTPFELKGKGSDPDGDALVYQWEERDLGPAGAPNTPTGTAPLFRSFPPVAQPSRVFPKLGDLLNNTQTIGEILPTTTRPLNFRFIVRDQREAPSAGGVASDDLSFNVTADAGPFRVTEPNTDVRATAGGQLKVKWDVARTDVAPVSCAEVNIWLSTDGGLTRGERLLARAPNTGKAKVTLPNLQTDQARIYVGCRSNVFFDVSDVNFRIR